MPEAGIKNKSDSNPQSTQFEATKDVNPRFREVAEVPITLNKGQTLLVVNFYFSYELPTSFLKKRRMVLKLCRQATCTNECDFAKGRDDCN